MDIRTKMGKWIESKPIQNFIIGLIIINAITIGLDTDGKVHLILGNYFKYIDNFILYIFILEIVIKLFAFRLQFFKDNWNWFDFLIVIISITPESGIFSVFRTLRILRTLRLLKKVPKLRMIIDALISSIPSIGWITALLGLVFYVFAVIATNLFGKEFPDWFGNMGKTMYTLFQIMTLESWSMGIVRPVMEKFPYAHLLFIPFILTATYTTLNIFIAVIVNAMNKIYDDDTIPNDKNEEELKREQFILNDNFLLEQKLEKLEGEMQEIKSLLHQIAQQQTIKELD
jgi:voltage-gated sodium channel